MNLIGHNCISPASSNNNRKKINLHLDQPGAVKQKHIAFNLTF